MGKLKYGVGRGKGVLSKHIKKSAANDELKRRRNKGQKGLRIKKLPSKKK